MTDLRTLSARVSEATGPSRELDAEIAVAVGHIKMKLCEGKWAFWETPIVKRQWAFLCQVPGSEQDAYGELGTCLNVPRYTASLNAVAALIAERLSGASWSVFSSDVLSARGCIWHADTDGSNARQCAKTPALALLSAALLAIHERNKSDDHR